MRPSRVVYRSLSAAIFPKFFSKLKKIEGQEHLPISGGFLLAANHVDWLDGFYIAAAIDHALNRPVHFLTKTNNYWWTTMTIQIPPDDRGTIIAKTIVELQRQHIVCNFPEGIRNQTKKVGPGKTGTARMALLAGVPVIPLGIICDSGATMAESLTFLFSHDHQVTLRFGQPIVLGHASADTLTAGDIQTGTETIMRALAFLADKTL